MAGGREVRCKDMVQNFMSFMQILSVSVVTYFDYKAPSNGKTAQAEDMPEPKTMMNVTMEANNVVSMAAARELYEEMIEEIVGGDK